MNPTGVNSHTWYFKEYLNLLTKLLYIKIDVLNLCWYSFVYSSWLFGWYSWSFLAQFCSCLTVDNYCEDVILNNISSLKLINSKYWGIVWRTWWTWNHFHTQTKSWASLSMIHFKHVNNNLAWASLIWIWKMMINANNTLNKKSIVKENLILWLMNYHQTKLLKWKKAEI